MSVHLEGTAGDDVLLGSEEPDFLRDELGGNDELYGAGDGDYLYVQRSHGVLGSVLIDGGGGNDFITFASDFHQVPATILAGDGNDHIVSTGGTEVAIDAGAGGDIIDIGHEGTVYTITLGEGADLVTFSGVSWVWTPGPGIVFTDFAAGDDGDRLSLEVFLAKLSGWDFYLNPFATGHLALEQRGDDAVLRIDRSADGETVIDFAVFEGVDASTLTAWNMGFAPDGSVTPGATFDGTDLADLLYGSGGPDTMNGGPGNDELLGGAGNDVLNGGDDYDRLNGQFGDDVVNGGGGGDSLRDWMGGNDQLFGGEGSDYIDVARTTRGPASDLLLDGGEGNDVFYFFAPASRNADHLTANGGAGSDTFTFDGPATAIIDAGEGDDAFYLTGLRTDYTLTLGAGSDLVYYSNYGFAQTGLGRLSFTDFQTGGAGDRFHLNDTLLQAHVHGWDGVSNPFATGNLRLGQRGAETVLQADRDGGADGFITLARFANIAAASLVAFNFDGYAPMGQVATVGSEGNDTLRGGAQADSLDGAGGNDVIDGRAGADRMIGGDGNDTYYIDNAGDKVFETSATGGVDLVYSGFGHTLGANFENLILTGTGHSGGTGNILANILIGNAGNNRLDGGAGADVMKGREGNDTFIVDDVGDRIEEAAGQGTDLVLASASHILANAVENLTLTGTGHIGGTGNGLSNLIIGNIGHNVLNGMGGADIMKGREGDDIYHVDHAGDVVDEAFNQGVDRVFASVSHVLDGDVENLILTGSAAIDGTGTLYANLLTGNAAANSLWGLGGGDVLDGGAGHDSLHGGAGNDGLTGGTGNDRLYGGTGQDVLTGGAGADGFYFDAAPGPANADTILHFDAAGDTIFLDSRVFTAFGAGPLPANAFVAGAASTPDHRIIYLQGSGDLLYDPDGGGNGLPVLFAQLGSPVGTLTHADFVVYTG